MSYYAWLSGKPTVDDENENFVSEERKIPERAEDVKMGTEQHRSKAIGIVRVDFGKNVTVVEPCNLYGCAIGDDSFVGPFTEIQQGAAIGIRTKVQSHTFICELVSIGNDCFIGHGVMFINDVFAGGGPAMGDKTKWKSTTIGNNVSIGSNATILPVRICDNVVIGAGAVVTKDIAEAGVYAGNPARRLK